MILSGLSIFGDARYMGAAAPLFNAGEVEVVEWTVDSWDAGPPPEEAAAILGHFSETGNLIGHGVNYPLLDAGADKKRAEWLSSLKTEVKQRSYCGVSVHFGFSTGWEIADGAPLPVPFCDSALECGREAMRALASAAGCRVGIENLALAFSGRDAETQGAFITALLEETDGYLLLDLHNIYCQSHNFGVDMLALAGTYPLSRVKEMHVAGGSWSETEGSWDRIRRDTHDGRIPDEVLEALPQVMAKCPNLEYVIFEKLPGSFEADADEESFRADFRRMKQAVQNATG